jgi:threonine synthase
MSGVRWSCGLCGASYPLDVPRYLCHCAAAGRLDLRLDGSAHAITDRADPTLWRYAALLPLSAEDPAVERLRSAYPAGGTPLHRADRMARALGVAELWIKNEAANPTGSIKDRASAVALAAALRFGARVITTASSGNAAASLAAAAAATGHPCVVFVPAQAPPAQIGQLTRYGARALLVEGGYHAAVQLCFAACDEWQWYCRTSAVNPYTTQGKKTAALEIVDQLGRSAPDAVVVPAGDGNVLVGLAHGFRDAVEMGWIDRMPRLLAVQASGAPALYRAWLRGEPTAAPVPASTIADGIGVSDPLDGTRALAAIRTTGGGIVTVTDAEILDAADRLAAEAGVWAEPTSAAGAAALPVLVAHGLLDAASRVVLVNTGAGPRTAGGAAERSGGPGSGAVRIAPDLAAVRAAVGDFVDCPAFTGHERIVRRGQHDGEPPPVGRRAHGRQ